MKNPEDVKEKFADPDLMCAYPNCGAGPFTRKDSVARHMQTVHGTSLKPKKQIVRIERVEKIAEEVLKKLPARKRFTFQKESRKDIALKPEVWVLPFSDLHFGAVVKAVEVGGLSSYNPDIARDRVHFLAQTIVRLLEYYPNTPEMLVIPFLGDIVDNTILRGSQLVTTEFGVTTQVIQAAEILAEFIRFTSKYFKTVKCFGIPGNHGRVTRNPTESHPGDSFDKLVYWGARTLIRNMEGISLTIPDSQHLIVNINGWKFWLEHGDTIRGWMGLPFYGAKREKANINEILSNFRESADYMILGHHHQSAEFNNIIFNGSFVGGDLYSIGRLRRLSIPSQNLLGVNKKHGVVWKRELQLIDEPRKIKPKIYSTEE